MNIYKAKSPGRQQAMDKELTELDKLYTAIQENATKIHKSIEQQPVLDIQMRRLILQIENLRDLATTAIESKYK